MSAIAGLLRRIIAQIDPHFDADRARPPSSRRQSRNRCAAAGSTGESNLESLFLAGTFPRRQPPGKLNLHAKAARVHHLVHRPLDRPPEAAPLHQLLGDVLGDQHGAAVRIVDFDDLQLHPAAGQILQLGLEPIDFLPLAADDDSGPGRVQNGSTTWSRVRSISIFGMPANWYFVLRSCGS